MAKQVINIGSVANDGTGDTLRDGADKINDNTNELYSLLGDGSSLSITGDVSMSAGATTIANDAVSYAKLGQNLQQLRQYRQVTLIGHQQQYIQKHYQQILHLHFLMYQLVWLWI